MHTRARLAHTLPPPLLVLDAPIFMFSMQAQPWPLCRSALCAAPPPPSPLCLSTVHGPPAPPPPPASVIYKRPRRRTNDVR
jgi:hypothetical protein